MILSKILYKVGIRKNIRHCLCYNFTAGLIVTHTGITGLLILDKVIYILSTLGEAVKNYLSKLIVLDRIPIFNKMCKFMGKSTQHSILCQIIRTIDIGKSSVQVNVNSAGFTSAISALSALKFTVLVCLRTIQNNINAGNLCNSAEILISFALGVVEGLFQVSDCNALALNSAFSASSLAVSSSLVLCLKVLCFGVGCSCACFIRKLLLTVRQVVNCLAALHIIERNATLAHIIGYLVCLVILYHILTGGVGMDHSLSLSAILL